MPNKKPHKIQGTIAKTLLDLGSIFAKSVFPNSFSRRELREYLLDTLYCDELRAKGKTEKALKRKTDQTFNDLINEKICKISGGHRRNVSRGDTKSCKHIKFISNKKAATQKQDGFPNQITLTIGDKQCVYVKKPIKV